MVLGIVHRKLVQSQLSMPKKGVYIYFSCISLIRVQQTLRDRKSIRISYYFYHSRIYKAQISWTFVLVYLQHLNLFLMIWCKQYYRCCKIFWKTRGINNLIFFLLWIVLKIMLIYYNVTHIQHYCNLKFI